MECGHTETDECANPSHKDSKIIVHSPCCFPCKECGRNIHMHLSLSQLAEKQSQAVEAMNEGRGAD